MVITFQQAIENINEYIKDTDFDIEYLEEIHNYLLNKNDKVIED